MAQLALFTHEPPDVPNTEGIKYAGSKKALLPYVLQLVHRTGAKTVFDAFSGTTRVSQALAQAGYRVVSNDLAVWSKTFATCYLKNANSRRYFQDIIDHLNALPGVDGWFTENYGGVPNHGLSTHLDGLKKPWQVHNTRKLDAIREEIDQLALSDVDRSVLLTSLIYALDEVDSTLGHFVSYLRQWSPRSYKTMLLRVPRLFQVRHSNEVLQKDILEVASSVKADVAYLDPPYGSNNEKMPPSRVRYASYYHLWTTVCLNDRPELFGKANRRVDSSDEVEASVFEDFRRRDDGRFVAVAAIDRVVRDLQTPFVILSYSSGGRATADELTGVLSRHGQVLELLKIDYRRNVMAGMRWTNEWIKETEEPNTEFLFLLEKT